MLRQAGCTFAGISAGEILTISIPNSLQSHPEQRKHNSNSQNLHIIPIPLYNHLHSDELVHSKWAHPVGNDNPRTVQPSMRTLRILGGQQTIPGTSFGAQQVQSGQNNNLWQEHTHSYSSPEPYGQKSTAMCQQTAVGKKIKEIE